MKEIASFNVYDIEVKKSLISEYIYMDIIKKLAYHEAGHLVIQTLIRKINFTVSINLSFPKPTLIVINEKEKTGCIQQCALPTKTFSWKHHMDEIIDCFNFHNFYKENKK